MRSVSAPLVLALFAFGCAHTEPAAPASAPAVAEAPKAPAISSRGVPPTADERTLEGTVSEVVDAAGYTYLQVALDSGRSVWAAAEKQPVENGSRVVMKTSIKMLNFRSNALNRTFEEIYFVTLAGVSEKPSVPSDMI